MSFADKVGESLWDELRSKVPPRLLLGVALIIGLAVCAFEVFDSPRGLRIIATTGPIVIGAVVLRIFYGDRDWWTNHRLVELAAWLGLLGWIVTLAIYCQGYRWRIGELSSAAAELESKFAWKEAAERRKKAQDIAHAHGLTSMEMTFLCDQGIDEYYLGNIKAESLLSRCLSLAVELRSREEQARANLWLGKVFLIREVPASAEHYLNAAVSLFHELQQTRGEAEAMVRLCRLHLSTQSPGEARSLCDRAVSLAQTAQDADTLANAYRSIGFGAFSSGDLNKADIYFNLALSSFYKTDDSLGRAYCLLAIAQLRLRQDRMLDAKAPLSEAEQTFAAAKENIGLARVAESRGSLAESEADYRSAQDQYARALDLFKAEGDISGQVRALRDLARIDLLQGSLKSATEHIEKARALDPADAELRIWLTLIEGDLSAMEGKIAEAEGKYEDARQRFQSRSNLDGEARAARASGRLALEQGHPDVALAELQLAHSQFIEAGDSDDFEAAIDLARAYQVLGYRTSARDLYGDALAHARTTGARLTIALALHGLADLDEEDHRYQAADTGFNEAMKILDALGLPLPRARLFLCLGIRSMRRGEFKEANGYYKTAIDLFNRAHNPIGVINVQVMQALLLAQQGRAREASAAMQTAIRGCTALNWRERSEKLQWIQASLSRPSPALLDRVHSFLN